MSDDIDTVDETAEKAKALGKELGVTEELNPLEDDYEINEVPDDDESLAKTRETVEEKSDREKLSNREKRQRKKQKINSIIDDKNSIIRDQQDRISAMEARLSQVDSRLAGISKAEVEKALADTAAVYKRAENDAALAFNDGDGVKHMNALKVLKDADDRWKHLQGVKQQLDRAPVQSNVAVETAISTRANEWASQNPWYDPAGIDDDSVLAQTLSAKMVKEGFDPKSERFWDELNKRIAKYMPDKVDAEEYDEEEVPAKITKRRAAPPIGGGSGRGDVVGKKTITLPTSYIEKMKRESPEIWNDPIRRKRVLDSRERILRETR